MKKNTGFTLLEIMVTLVISFFIFLMIYRTFHTVCFLSTQIDKKTCSKEIVFNFLQKFSSEIKNLVDEENSFEGTSYDITFLSKNEMFLYPVRISYTIKSGADERLQLWRTEENLIYERTFSFPVIIDADKIYFSYGNESEWYEDWDKKDYPKQVAVYCEIEGFEIDFPVNFPCRLQHEKKSEKK